MGGLWCVIQGCILLVYVVYIVFSIQVLNTFLYGPKLSAQITYGAPYKKTPYTVVYYSTAHIGVYTVFMTLTQILTTADLLRF